MEMSVAMVGMIVEKLRQLIMEEIGGIGGGEVEGIRSSLREMQRLLERKSPKQLLWGNWEGEVEELVYEADDVVDEMMYDGLVEMLKSRSQNEAGSVIEWLTGGGGIFFFLNKFLLAASSKLPLEEEEEELAGLTRRIRLVNARLLTATAAADYEDDVCKSVPCSIVANEKDLLVLDDDVWKKDFDLDEFVVGRKDAREDVISHLLAAADEDVGRDLKIIGICGMGGIGKTTLANLVYQDCSIRTHFDCIAWATVGKDFRTRNILEDLLLQNICRSRDEMMPFSDLGLAQKLYEFLQPKRYLIVLDDVWSTDAWECLRIAIPSRETTASRVLLTTRDTRVADKIASSANKGFVHRMRGLSQDEGWELLRKTAFRGHSSDFKVDAELLDIGKDIVKRCQGLPLAIRLMAGLLASKPILHKWKTVQQNMVSYLIIDQGSQDTAKVNRILALSYDFLPHHLKPCFLYMCMFPEDVEIEAERLYLLWLAEGFLSSTHGSGQVSVMDVAERYLNELAIRSMVTVHKEELSTFTRLKSCRVHDLLRDFCLLKAKEQNYCDSINFRHANDTGLDSCSPFSTPRIRRLAVSFEDGCVVPYDWNTDKCLQSVSIQSTSRDQQQFASPRKLSDLKDLSRLRGLYLSGFNFKVMRLPSISGELFPRQFLSLRYLPQILSDLANFKRLRVLVFSGFNFDVTRLPTGIEKLFRLRHLSIRDCNITRLPSTIGSLLNLETLDLGEGTWIRMLIPNELQKLIRLRYLYLPHTFRVYEGDKLQLDGLIKLETLVNFVSRLCRVKDLPKLTKLRKLVAIIDGNFEDLEETINCVNTSLTCLRFLSLVVRNYYSKNHFVIHKLLECEKLHILQIEGRIRKLPLLISQSLTEISLTGSELDDDPMQKLEKLPNLCVLLLQKNAFLGKHMTCSGTGMPQLKYLSLSNLQNLENLTVKKGGMPKLSTLVLEGCWNLKKLPEGMSFLTSLQELTVAQMPQEFMDWLNGTGEDFPKFQNAPIFRISWPSQKLKMCL